MIGDGSGGILRGDDDHDGTGSNDDIGNDGDLGDCGGDEGGIGGDLGDCGGDEGGIGGASDDKFEGGKSEIVIIFPPNK